MAIYRVPKKIEKPVFSFKNIRQYDIDVEKYINEIKKFCEEYGSGDYRGKIFSFGVADGKAMYMVFSIKPLKIIHIDVYDEYQYDGIVYMKGKDIINKIEQEAKFNDLFK